MKDAINRLSKNMETLIGELHEVKTELQTVSSRLDAVEKQTASIGSGLAVVLNRSEENKEDVAANKKKSNGWRVWPALSTGDSGV